MANVDMTEQDIDYLLSASPVLETLELACFLKLFHLRSQSLRSVLVSPVEELAVVEAPLLERLILFKPCARADPARIKIASTSNLRVLGYMEPMPDTVASPSDVVPGIKILGLSVNFSVLEEVKMVASLLRCFPNMYTLHIQSVMGDPSESASEPTGEHHAKFWQEASILYASPVECLRSHVKGIVFHRFRGHQSEFEFLKFVARDARSLQSLLLVPPKENVISVDEVNEMIDKLGCPSFRAWTSKVLLVSPKVDNDWSPVKRLISPSSTLFADQPIVAYMLHDPIFLPQTLVV
ncbi:hypothetical protein ACQ4PT_018084 [Festuca glaucescens]